MPNSVWLPKEGASLSAPAHGASVDSTDNDNRCHALDAMPPRTRMDRHFSSPPACDPHRAAFCTAPCWRTPIHAPLRLADPATFVRGHFCSQFTFFRRAGWMDAT